MSVILIMVDATRIVRMKLERSPVLVMMGIYLMLMDQHVMVRY